MSIRGNSAATFSLQYVFFLSFVGNALIETVSIENL